MLERPKKILGNVSEIEVTSKVSVMVFTVRQSNEKYPRSMVSSPFSRQLCTVDRAIRCSSGSFDALQIGKGSTGCVGAEISLQSNEGPCKCLLDVKAVLSRSSPHAGPSSDESKDSAPDSSLPIQTPLSRWRFSLKSALFLLGSITCSPHQVPRYRRLRPVALATGAL